MICDDRTPEERTAFLMDRVRHLCAQSAISGRMPTDTEMRELRDDVRVAFARAEKRGASQAVAQWLAEKKITIQS